MVAPSDMDDETEALIRQLQQQDAAEYNRSRGLGRRERKAPEVYVPPPPGVGTLALGQPLRLRAANSPAPGGEWKARLRGCDVPQYCPPVPLPTSAPRPATPIAIP